MRKSIFNRTRLTDQMQVVFQAKTHLETFVGKPVEKRKESIVFENGPIVWRSRIQELKPV